MRSITVSCFYIHKSPALCSKYYKKAKSRLCPLPVGCIRLFVNKEVYQEGISKYELKIFLVLLLIIEKLPQFPVDRHKFTERQLRRLDFVHTYAIFYLRRLAFLLRNVFVYPRDTPECGQLAVFSDCKSDVRLRRFGIIRNVPTHFPLAVFAKYFQKSGCGIDYPLQLPGRHPVKVRVDIIQTVINVKFIPVGIQTDVLSDTDGVFPVIFNLTLKRSLFPLDKRPITR